MIVRMKSVKKVTAKGRAYFYHRGTGARLPDDPRSAAFHEAWKREEAKLAGRTVRAGTFGGLMVAYRGSPEFLNLADSTRRDYARIMAYLEPLATTALAEFDTPAVMRIRDKAAKRGYREANYVLAVMSRLFSWGLPRGITSSNPVKGAEKVRRPAGKAKANRAWSSAELAFVTAAAAPGIALAVEIAAATGQREGDVVRLTWTAFRDGKLHLRQRKTGQQVGITLPAGLASKLDRLPRTAPNIIVGERGRPYTRDGFGTVFFRLIAELVADECVAPGLTFHGLRHTAGVTLALCSATTSEIQAVLGCTAQMAEHYSSQANREELAQSAVAKRERTRN